MAADCREIIGHFQVDGEIRSVNPYGNGHINDTYLAELEDGQKVILQRMNRNVFQKPEELMENIHKTNLLHLGGAVLLIYVVVLAFFVAVSYFVYRAKYNAAQKGLKAYLENLKKLDELYKDDKTKAGYTASIGGVVKYDEYSGT